MVYLTASTYIAGMDDADDLIYAPIRSRPKPVFNKYLQRYCPKCGHLSGDDWSQCGNSCPMEMSPYYDGV